MPRNRSSEELGRLLVAFFFIVAASGLVFAGVNSSNTDSSTQILGETAEIQAQSEFSGYVANALNGWSNYTVFTYNQTVGSPDLKMDAEYMTDLDSQLAYSRKEMTNPATGETVIQEESVHDGLVNIRSDQGVSQFRVDFQNPLTKTTESFLSYLQKPLVSETKTELDSGAVRYTFRTNDEGGEYNLEAVFNENAELVSLTFPYSEGGTNTISITSTETEVAIPTFTVDAVRNPLEPGT